MPSQSSPKRMIHCPPAPRSHSGGSTAHDGGLTRPPGGAMESRPQPRAERRRLSHMDRAGRPRMVDVSDKPMTARRAVAEAAVAMSQETLSLVIDGGGTKGDVLGVAELAGVMGGRRTSRWSHGVETQGQRLIAMAGTPNRSALVITASDGAVAGVRDDTSGAQIQARLETLGFTVDRGLVPDDRRAIEIAIVEGAGAHDLVVTTGGTGLTPRDVTPQATHAAIDYEVPGLAEAMRAAGRASTPLADLSRGVVGVRGRTLVVK